MLEKETKSKQNYLLLVESILFAVSTPTCSSIFVRMENLKVYHYYTQWRFII